jgi:hypothetical protein
MVRPAFAGRGGGYQPKRMTKQGTRPTERAERAVGRRLLQRRGVTGVLAQHSLSLTMFGLFALFLWAQSVAGHRAFNEEQRAHDEPAIGYVAYLGEGHFVEAVFENWESEFLQMSGFVLFTVFLRQRGSPESKKLVGREAVDKDPSRAKHGKHVPWPVRRGGLVLRLYENSLSIVLFLLFVGSLTMHAVGGVDEYNVEQREHGGRGAVSALEYMTTSQFWFESFQNWQSEFLAVGALAVLAIYLRQRGSPESKPVAAPHDETGSE